MEAVIVMHQLTKFKIQKYRASDVLIWSFEFVWDLGLVICDFR